MRDFVVQDPEIIDEKLINERLLDHDEVRVQFSKPIYTKEILSQLNTLALTNSSKFKIRFYGSNNTGIDCEILDYIPNVKALSIDCTNKVKNINKLKQLKFLEKISIGISELEDLDILSYDNLKTVNKLSILDTRSKAFNLEFLRDYVNLTYLQIVGHTKNINSISNLKQLETLSLNSISKVPLDFINHLKSLKTLRIILGGRDNINEITQNTIENLDIIWVRGLNDLSALKNFKNLKNLLVQDEIKLKEISFPKLDSLEDVKILNCKSLQLITGIEQLKSLNGFRVSKTAIDFEDFSTIKFPKNLKTLAFYTWKSKQDKIIRSRLNELGYDEF